MERLVGALGVPCSSDNGRRAADLQGGSHLPLPDHLTLLSAKILAKNNKGNRKSLGLPPVLAWFQPCESEHTSPRLSHFKYFWGCSSEW